jgi:hypothetical protein
VSDAADRPPPRGRAALVAGALLGIAGWALFATSLAAESVQWAPHATGGWAGGALLGLARTLTPGAASGELGNAAGLLWPLVLALSLVAATAGWILAVRSARERALPLGALLALTLVFAALANAAPGLLSSDVYAYIRLGRMAALLGANPFSEAPLAVPDGYVDDRWFMAEHVSPYGPLWIAVAAALAKLAELARLGFGDFVQLHRWLATACHCANAAMIHRIAEGRRPGSGSAASAAYALCPLAIVEVCSGAHNEVFLIGLLLLGIAQVLRSRPWLASALFAAASLIKLTALLAWAAHAALVARTARGRSEAVKRVFAIGLGAAALAALAYLPFWNGAGALASHEMLLGLLFGASPTNSLAEWLGTHALAPGWPPQLALRAAGAFCGMVFLGTVAVQLARTRDGGSFLRAIHAGFFAWSAFGASWNQPWYALTATAMAAIAPPSRLRDATWLLSVSVLAMYPLHALGDPTLYAQRGLAMGGIPLAYLGLALLSDRRRGRCWFRSSETTK